MPTHLQDQSPKAHCRVPSFAWLHNRLQLISPLNTQLCGAASFCQERPQVPFSRARLHFSKGLARQFSSPGNPSPPLSSNPSFTPQPIPGHYYSMPPAHDSSHIPGLFYSSELSSCYKAYENIGAKRTQHFESGYLNSRLFGAGDTFMTEISPTQCGKLIYLSRSTFALSLHHSPHCTSPHPFAGISLNPWRLRQVSFLPIGISCGQAVHTGAPTTLILQFILCSRAGISQPRTQED